MSNSIASRTISAANDRRIVLGSGQAKRRPIYLATWTKVRFAIRFSFDGSANITGTPLLFMGMCGGVVNGYANTYANALGFASISSTWTLAGTPAYYGNPLFKARKRLDTTNIDGSNNFSAYLGAAPASIRNALVVEITKGSPNFTLNAVCPTTTAGAQTDISELQLVNMMEAATMAGAAAVVSGYGEAGASNFSVAMDEAANGYLDCFDIYWDRSTVPLEISNIYHRRIS